MTAAPGYRKPRAGQNERRSDAVADLRSMLAAEDGVTSLWVGYWLPPDVAKKLAVRNGEPPEDLHMTLCFLGNAPALPDDALERLQAAVKMFSLSQAAISFRVTGAARFSAADSGADEDVIYATVAGESVYEFQWRLSYALESVGLSSPSQYGFTPHITLAYVDPGTDVSLKLPNAEVTLDRLTISKGKGTPPEDREDFELRPPAYRTMAAFEIGGGTVKAMEPPATIPCLPIPGLYYHPLWGNIDLSEARLQNFVTNFENTVYQDRLPIDLEHETKLSGAAGWITGLAQNPDGSVDAVVEWTDRGVAALKADRFGFVSPEWYDYWTDPISGIDYSDILIGAALCTRPFFKAPALRPLGASEMPQTHKEGHDMPKEDQATAANANPTPTPAPAPQPQPAATPAPVVMSEQQAREFAEMREQFAALKNENSALKATNEQYTTQMTAMGATVKQLSDERRRERFTAIVTGTAGGNDGASRWFGEPAKHVGILEHIANTAGEDSETFKDYVSQQNAIAEQLKTANVNPIFKEIGSNGDAPAPTDLNGRLETAVRKAMEANPKLSEPEAITHVVMSDPTLAGEYRAHLRDKGRRTGGAR